MLLIGQQYGNATVVTIKRLLLLRLGRPTKSVAILTPVIKCVINLIDRIHFDVILEWLKLKVTKTKTKIQQIFVDKTKTKTESVLVTKTIT